jgi:hypothetical protein
MLERIFAVIIGLLLLTGGIACEKPIQEVHRPSHTPSPSALAAAEPVHP